jgi:glyoxylase-like metal-dependent hydrolase (beta-lactamase superfamily II)
MRLERLAPDVYACLQPDRGLGWSNSGLVDRGGGLVVDTFWDLPRTRQLIETYARVWKAPARRVVNTHHNGDHCWGNQLFAGAEIIAHRACALAIGRDISPSTLEAIRTSPPADPSLAWFARALSEWDFRGIELRPPTTVFDDRWVLDLDGLEVHLRWLGPAHTAGDTIVHLPAEGVVFAGDLIFRRCTPIGWEGTFDRWIAALDEIAALDPKVIVPGHGPLSGVEGALEMKAYLQYVRSEARRFYEAGLPELEAAKRIDLGPYAGWTEPERIVFNVARAYREFRGEPFDAPIDAVALLRAMDECRRSRAGKP